MGVRQRLLRSLSLAAIAAVVLFVPRPAAAVESFTVTELSGYSYGSATIAGDRIAWTAKDDFWDGSDDEVFTWTPTSGVTKVTSNYFADVTPDVSGDRIVWAGHDGADHEVFTWTPSSGVVQITDNQTQDVVPQVCGDRITWLGAGGSDGGTDDEVFTWTAETGIVQLTRDNNMSWAPQTSVDRVVWYGHAADGGADYEVFMWTEGSGVQQLTDNEYGMERHARIDGDRVVWMSGGGGSDMNGDNEIMMWTPGTGVVELTTNPVQDLYPEVSGDRVVWAAEGGSDGGADIEIFTWTPTGIQQVSTNTSDDLGHGVSGGRIAWYGRGGADAGWDDEIFTWTANAGLTCVTVNDLPDTTPLVSSNRIVWVRAGGLLTAGFPPNPVNQAPVANSFSTTALEDTWNYSIALTGNDHEGDPLTYEIVSHPQHGILTDAGGGTYWYLPAWNYNGPDAFTFRAFDGTSYSEAAQVVIDVAPVNDAPYLVDLPSAQTWEDTAVEIQLGGAADYEGDPLSYEVVSQPSHGTLSAVTDGNRVTYTPDPDFNSLTATPETNYDSFTFVATDGDRTSPPIPMRITVKGVNDPPVLNPDEFAMDEDALLVIWSSDLTANDYDHVDTVPQDLIYVSSVTPTAETHGTIVWYSSYGVFTPAPNFNGIARFNYTASDTNWQAGEGTAQSTVTVTVRPVNDYPVAGDDSFTTAENTSIEIPVASLLANDSDVDGEPLWFNSGNAYADENTHGTIEQVFSEYTPGEPYTVLALRYTPDPFYNGPASFRYLVNAGTSGGGSESYGTVSLSVTPVTPAPTLSSFADPVNASNAGAVTVVGAAEPSVNVTIYAKGTGDQTTPVVVTSDEAGAFAATLDVSGLNDGPISYVVSYVDPYGNTSPESKADAVKDTAGPPEPALSSAPDIDHANVSALPISGTAEPGTTVRVTVSDKNGDSASGSGTALPDGSFAFEIDASALADGPVTYIAVSTDAAGNQSNPASTSADKDTNRSPNISADNETVTVAEGDSATNSGSALDPDGTSLSIKADRGSAVIGSDGTWTWSFATTDASDSGPVTITVSDGVKSTQVTFALAVTEVAPTPSIDDVTSATEGSAVTLTGSFTDPGADSLFTGTVDWGDGTSGTLTVDSATKSFSATHVYADDGAYTAAVAITDEDGSEGMATHVVTVGNVAPEIEAGPVAAVIPESGTYSGTLVVSDPGADGLAVTVDWGDGSTTSYAAVSGIPCGISHSYASAGSHSVTINVVDDVGAAVSSTYHGLVSVVDVTAPSAPSLSQAPDITSANQGAVPIKGTAEPGSTVVITATDRNGETAGGTCSVETNGTFSVAVDCSSLADGPIAYAATATDASGNVSDPASASGDKSTAVTPNTPPQIGAITGPVAPVPVGTSVSVSVSISDPDDGDAFSATFDWSDGTTSQLGIASGGTTAASTHTYQLPGVYPVRLRVSDGEADASTAFEYVVVYDPSGGFVTGGGRFESPVGAYVADPELFGKATFGFVSKYKRGASVPSGETEFQFHAASFNFKSTSYEWLVVSGTKAQFKGEGTVNGSGTYRFLLTCIDGSPDRIRMKVIDQATGALVYDNQIGANDTDAPTLGITGGSIIVHK